jgi:ABC-type sugar transport system permease subunit
MAAEKSVLFKSSWLPWLLLAPQLIVIAVFFFLIIILLFGRGPGSSKIKIK